MSEIKDTFKFSLRGKDSLASKWIEQKRSVSGTLKNNGAGVFAIGDYIYEVFCINKLSSGQITKNNLYAKIMALNNLTNESIVKFEDVIDIPFVHQVKKFTKVPDISFASISKSLSEEKINNETQSTSEILTFDEIKIMAINYFHIRYDRREKDGVKDKTYDEIINRPILYFGTDTELDFIFPDYRITQEKKVVESSKEVPANIVINKNLVQVETNKSKCFCNREITVEEMTSLIYELRDKENYKSKRECLFTDGDECVEIKHLPNKTLKDSKEIEQFTKEINRVFITYGINTCNRKIHMLAQCYCESNRFLNTSEIKGKDSYKGGIIFKGRGLIQLTHDYTYLAYYDYKNSTKYYKEYQKRSILSQSVVDFMNEKNITGFDKDFYDNKFIPFAKKVATNLDMVIDSAGWFVKEFKSNSKILEKMDNGLSE